MGWKSLVRTMERNARRHQKELEAQRKQMAKMQETQRAQYEVKVFQNQLDILTSIHKDSSEALNWRIISESAKPSPPIRQNMHEKAAKNALEAHKPGFMASFLKDKKKQDLEQGVQHAIQRDNEIHQRLLSEWEEEVEHWSFTKEISHLVLKGDTAAKLKILTEINPFEEISDFGSKVKATYLQGKFLEVSFFVHGTDIIPNEEKSLLKSGKLSVKKMSPSKFNEIYQDYVCSCILRIASEVFAVLPDEVVYITALDEVLNTKTGHKEDSPIVSVCIPRKTLQSLNLETIDPSDSFANFVHAMSFKKAKGFEAVKKIEALSH